MKRALIVLAAVAGLHGAVYGETYHWVDSRGGVHYAHDIESVPKQYRKQVERRGVVIKDPVLRAALEKESRRVIAMREEAIMMARARIRREAEEARRKKLAFDKERLAKERKAAREKAAQGNPRKREVPGKEKIPVQSVAEK